VGICHRDIKPANFIVSEDVNKTEKIKLIDFGESAFKTIG
jgi:serine/threonine protein kinase